MKNGKNNLSFIRQASHFTLYITHDFLIKEMSSAVEEFYGWNRQDVINRSYPKLCQQYNAEVFLPTNYKKNLNQISYNSYKKEITHAQEKMTLEYGIIQSNDNSSSIQGFIITVSYPSKRTQNNIAKVKSYYEDLIYHMPGNVYWLDRNCVTLGCNKNVVKLIGLKSREEFIGITYEEMGKLAGWTEGQAESFKKDDMHVMSTGVPIYNVEEPPLYDEEGNPVYYLSSRVPLKNNMDEVIGVVGISINITDKKKVEAELKQQIEVTKKANQSKSLFLTVMSHELTNRLGNIMSAMDIAQREVIKNNDYSQSILDCLSLAYTEAKSILPFLKNVIEYLELDSGLIDSKLVSVQLTEMISKLATENSDKLKTNNTEILLNITNSIPSNILVDSYNVYRVLDIVISNAIRFTHNGTITIKAQIEHSNYLSIIVQDTGKGITELQLKNIFNAFSSHKADVNSKYKKFGLKLSIAKQIMNLINGDIIISSQKDEGTNVKLIVPYKVYKVERNVDIDCSKHHMKDNEASKNLKLLVIEDDPVSLNLQANILNSMGYNVHFVSTAEEAIEKVKQHQYDLLFMDITLPGMTGIEASKEIRKIYTNKLLIIAVTSHANEESVEDILANGIDELIEKPINQEKFEYFFNITYPSLLKDRD